MINEDYFVCPISHHPLSKQGHALVCECGKSYALDDKHGYWNFLPDQDHDLERSQYEKWKLLQSNGEIAYEMDPINNIGVNDRPDHAAFAKFCDYNGMCLDIGSGPQAKPCYLPREEGNAQYIGLDPLIGVQPKQYNFVRGIAEYLPFRSKLFDRVSFFTSLDHVVNPTKTLSEACRVLKTDGQICIWISEKNSEGQARNDSPQWYRDLSVPEGVSDPFHILRLSQDILEPELAKQSIAIIEKKLMSFVAHRTDIFYRVKPASIA